MLRLMAKHTNRLLRFYRYLIAMNRIPLAGKITQSVHIPGKFLAAMRGDIDKKMNVKKPISKQPLG